MKKHIRWIILFGLTGLALPAPAALGRDNFVNEELGYRIRTPKDFVRQSGLNLGSANFFDADSYIADQFESERPLPPKSWLQWPYKLQMVTFYFPKRSAAEIAKAREEDEKRLLEQAKDGQSTVTVMGAGKLYQGFEEYAKERILGFFFEQERKAQVAGFDAVLYEMKFEKLANVPQRWMACTYQIPGGEFAVLFSCTEDDFDKYKGTFTSSFKSFKLLDAAGLNTQPIGGNSLTVDLERVDEDELTADELLARREEQKREAYEKCIEELPKGWRQFESDHFLVVYESPPKYAKDVARQAEAVIEWLGEQFGHVGSGIIQGSIIRVFEKEPDFVLDAAWLRSAFGGKGVVREIRFGRPDSRGWTAEFQSLNRSVMSNWFNQKNPELWSRMPYWLRTGLEEYVEDAELKGSRLTFGVDEWEKDSWVDAKLADKKFEADDPEQAPIKPLKVLIGLTASELTGGGNWRYCSAQCSRLVRYLMEGPGAKQPKTRSVLPHYVGHLYDLVEEVEARIEKEEKDRLAREKAAEGLSDEERLKAEDEEYRKRRDQAYDSVAKELLEKAFARTFKDWSDSDWAVFDSSFRKYADGNLK